MGSSNRKFGRVHIVVCCLVFASLLLILYHAAPSSRQGPVDTIDTPSQSIVISDPNNTTKPDADEKTDPPPPPPPPINPANPDPNTAPPSKQGPDEPLPPTVNPDPNNVPPPPKQDEPDEPLPPTVITEPDITIVDPPKQLPKKPLVSPPQPVVPPNNTIDDPSKQVPDEPIKAPTPPPPPEPIVITTPKITFNPAAGQTYGYSVIPADTRYFTQQFVVHGLGHKWCELLLGIRFARLNNLTYVFDEKTFLYNYRQSDLTWIGDLVKRRYGKLLDDYTPEYNTEEWIHAPDFMYDAAVLYQETMKEDDKKTYKGFYTNEWTQCENPDTGNQGCWTNGIPYYNITRDLQDILALPEKKEVEAPKEPVNNPIVNRVAIHVRLGDIRNLLTPESYQDLIRGIEIKHQVIIPIENVNFVYYEAHPDDRNNEDDKAIRDLKKKMPKAKYHNFENTGDTVQFLAHSKFLVTSGSSLSYLAAYLCPDCQVVFVKPKEYNSDPFDETNFTDNFYYMTGWEPHFRYLNLAD